MAAFPAPPFFDWLLEGLHGEASADWLDCGAAWMWMESVFDLKVHGS